MLKFKYFFDSTILFPKFPLSKQNSGDYRVKLAFLIKEINLES